MRFDRPRAAAAAILLLVAGRRIAANEDDVQLYQFQWDAPGISYESATTDGPVWSGSSYFFYDTDPATPTDPDDLDGGGGGDATSQPADPPAADPSSSPATDSTATPSQPADPAPEDPAPAEAAPDVPPSAPTDDAAPSPDDSQPSAPQPAPAPPAPAPTQAQAQTQNPGPEIARLRFNPTGQDDRVVGQPEAEGSSFIWTDPSGLAASPWPSFQNPSAPAVAESASLSQAPVANH